VAGDSRTPGSTAEPDGHRPSGRFQHSCSAAAGPTGDSSQGDDERGERFVVERQRFATGSIAKRFDHSGDEFAGVLLAPSPPPQTQSQASSQAQVDYLIDKPFVVEWMNTFVFCLGQVSLSPFREECQALVAQ